MTFFFVDFLSPSSYYSSLSMRVKGGHPKLRLDWAHWCRTCSTNKCNPNEWVCKCACTCSIQRNKMKLYNNLYTQISTTYKKKMLCIAEMLSVLSAMGNVFSLVKLEMLHKPESYKVPRITKSKNGISLTSFDLKIGCNALVDTNFI